MSNSVTVITPTIGQSYLLDAIHSVQKQTYDNIEHLLVSDGPEYTDLVRRQVLSNRTVIPTKSIIITSAPNNTGGKGGPKSFYGHRIYAGYPHFINTQYIAFLDEDNWYEPNHIESLVKTLEDNNYDWVYSLRNIYTREKNFVDQDNCESLGKWPIQFTVTRDVQHLVDTSSYLFKTEFLIQVCNHWHFGWGGDRRFYNILTRGLQHTNFHTSGKYTLNYRLDDNMEKKYGSKDFFKDGNEQALKHYGGQYPWVRI